MHEDLVRSYLNNIIPLSATELDTFVEKATKVSIKKGDHLCRIGQAVDYCYFMDGGIVRHYIIGKKNKEFTKNFIQRTGVFSPSLSDFFMRRPAQIFCEALVDFDTFRWDYHFLMECARHNPVWYRLFLQTVVGAFAGKERKEISVNQLTAAERYHQFRLDYPDIEQHISQHYIASFLNITPETLSRVRGKK